VRIVGWHPVSGYRATVKYSDGYIEILKIQELEVSLRAESARRFERAGMIHVVHTVKTEYF
jgi:hypothetical protein